MLFIAGLWTVEAHLNAAVVNNNSSARIWANTSLVMSSQLPRNISSYSHIYYRTDDVHFVTLNQLLFQKVRKSQSKTLLSHLQPMMLTYLVFTSTHLSPGWKIASGNFHWPVLELQLLLFWGGFFFCLNGRFISYACWPASLHWFWKPSSHPPFCWVHFSIYQSVLNPCLWNVFLLRSDIQHSCSSSTEQLSNDRGMQMNYKVV